MKFQPVRIFVVLAAFAAVSATGACGGADGAAGANSTASSGSKASDGSTGKPLELKPVGDAPPVVAESVQTLRLSTPQETLLGVLDARKRGDRAYLARACSYTAGKATINQADLNRANRQFLKGPGWDKIEKANAEDKVTYVEDGDTARAIAEVGGDMGQMMIKMCRIGGVWYIEVAGGSGE